MSCQADWQAWRLGCEATATEAWSWVCSLWAHLALLYLKMCNLIFGLPTLEPVVLGGTSNTTVSFIVSLCRQTDAAAH